MLLSPPSAKSSSSPPAAAAALPPTHDAYGFAVENDIIVKNGVTTTAGEEAWDKHASSTLCNFRTDSLENIILEHGVPTSRRAGLWFQWSGAEEKKSNALEENITYSTYIHQDISKKVRQQIALDLPRTCPKHPAFEWQLVYPIA